MPDPCPSQAELDRFLSLDSPASQNFDLFIHIENCPLCMAHLARQAGEPLDFKIDIPENQLKTQTPGEPDLAADLPHPDQLGDYKVVRYISRGGMGVVYECTDGVLNRPVALKVLNANKLSSETLARIDREAVIQSRLNHPDIVTIYEFSKAGRWPYIVMELVDGQSLSQLLQGKPISPRKAARIVARLARAIDYAHKMGVLHRDLKPSNVLIAGDISILGAESHTSLSPLVNWSLKVIDFGLSRWLDDSQQITLSTNIVGTPAYIAPELTVIGSKPVGASADIHALGVILYECLIGRPPFVAENALQTLDLIRSQEPVAPATILPELPRDLNTICLKCLEKEPSKRYATALALAEELERYLNGFPIHARPLGPLARVLRWCGRNRSLAASLATATSLLIFLIVGSIYFGYSQARLRQAAEESDNQSRIAIDNMQQQGIQSTNVAYFTTGLFDQIRKDTQGRPISIVEFLDSAQKDLLNERVDTLEGKTTFLICVAMAYDRVGEVAKANKILEAAEETLTTKITHDFSAAPYIKGYLIRAFLQQNKPNKAIFWLKDALTNLEMDNRLISQVGLRFLEQLADASLAVNRPEEAIAFLEKALHLQQTSPEHARRDMTSIRQRLGKLYNATGRTPEAADLKPTGTP